MMEALACHPLGESSTRMQSLVFSGLNNSRYDQSANAAFKTSSRARGTCNLPMLSHEYTPKSMTDVYRRRRSAASSQPAKR